MKRRSEVEELKRQWLEDPCWDIEETEGFEEYKEELLRFRLYQEKAWNEEENREEIEKMNKAKKLGLKGLYDIILRQEEEINTLKQNLDRLEWRIINERL